MYIKSHSEFEH